MGRRTYEAGELTRSEFLRNNERIKAVSGLCMNVGLALVIAGVGRWFYTAVDENTIMWLIVGPIAIWTGLHVLTLLESEN